MFILYSDISPRILTRQNLIPLFVVKKDGRNYKGMLENWETKVRQNVSKPIFVLLKICLIENIHDILQLKRLFFVRLISKYDR
jgi:hypothetical protein